MSVFPMTTRKPVQSAPSTVLGKEGKRPPPPRRLPNAATRTREHLLPDEVERLLKATRKSRNPVRDYTFILLLFRRALRVTEAIRLRWTDIDLPGERIFIKRLKSGVD